MIHYHTTQVLGHEVVVKFALFAVSQGVVAVTFQDEDFSLTKGLDSLTEVIVVGLHLTFEDDLTVALETWSGCKSGNLLFELSIITERLWNGVGMNAFGHDFFLQIS